MKERYWIILISVILLNSYILGCISDKETLSDEEKYQMAIEDAKYSNGDDIVDDLIAISEDNSYIKWRGESNNRTLLVAVFTSYDTYFGFENQSMETDWGIVWVTVVSEMKTRITEMKLEPDEIRMRTIQLLGLPPDHSGKYVAELWVNPDDMFRPSPDPEINDSVAQLDFPENVNNTHKSWINELKSTMYTENGYPWTGLGYTYDWGDSNNHIGLSEFCINQDSIIWIHSVQTLEDYIE